MKEPGDGTKTVHCEEELTSECTRSVRRYIDGDQYAKEVDAPWALLPLRDRQAWLRLVSFWFLFVPRTIIISFYVWDEGNSFTTQKFMPSLTRMYYDSSYKAAVLLCVISRTKSETYQISSHHLNNVVIYRKLVVLHMYVWAFCDGSHWLTKKVA